ncbi:MAG: hypothetical protein JSW13_00580 [Candidatus Aerophobus sp.]|nr:MAG: hypothetical protein JSW13_00580 [Candidatus Aerophobus sp.]
MLINKKRRFHRGVKSVSGGSQASYNFAKIKVPLLREFYQSSCGIEEFLGKEAGRLSLSFVKTLVTRRVRN